MHDFPKQSRYFGRRPVLAGAILWFLFPLLLNSPCLCLSATGSSQPLCRWWRLAWLQMTPLYSQSDDLFLLYGPFSLLTFVFCFLTPYCSPACILFFIFLALHALPSWPLVGDGRNTKNILIGWLWGCAVWSLLAGRWFESASQNKNSISSSPGPALTC